MPTRREFLSAAAAGSLALASRTGLAAIAKAAKPLHLLILGGTRFLGPAVVEYATARGHRVTLFNRGRSNPGMFPALETLIGDRDPRVGAGLSALEGRAFDAVVDTSGHVPRIVRASAGLLGPNIGQYVYISSISVYADTSRPGLTEDAPLATMDDPTIEEFGAEFENYGPLKALSERAAETALPGRATIVRPGLIVGPRDATQRFTYWPVRVERGGEILAPGTPDDPVQYIDVRDLAEFVVGVIETKTVGRFNASGPTWPTTIAELVHGCKAVTGGDARFTWVDAAFLAANEVQPWANLPVWVPPEGEYAGFHRVDLSRAIAAGLRSRPLAQVVEATLMSYHASERSRPFPWAPVLTPDRERELLAAWRARSSGSSG